METIVNFIELGETLAKYEESLYDGLRYVRDYYAKIAKKDGQIGLLNFTRADLQGKKVAAEKFSQIEQHLTELAHVFAIHNVQGDFLNPKGSPVYGLDLTSALKRHLEGKAEDTVEMVREIFRQSRLTQKTKERILELFE
ncbi:hypothetical protein [Deinococcus cellulosilyticus]|uniref:Uncharacterized protein n=1 Tax=Deinococcus cellulosilyticus (strain DSM 18568 / NBRC 106333 / KACC 11606 / 5516J-15) TaxID=1223518 RepID=A0A511N9Y7_DEIC1|nr:hypothetical protein [Deinococcus cellulosilyticus]GEM49644.1 hypothetical protein DC3_52790 [Deinococcus cellulosilyticus NBRC 106333 = KACC 11606]